MIYLRVKQGGITMTDELTVSNKTVLIDGEDRELFLNSWSISKHGYVSRSIGGRKKQGN
jgi:hypothetical protein